MLKCFRLERLLNQNLCLFFSISGISVPRETPRSPSEPERASTNKVPLSSPSDGSGARPKYSSTEKESSSLFKKENSTTGR